MGALHVGSSSLRFVTIRVAGSGSTFGTAGWWAVGGNDGCKYMVLADLRDRRYLWPDGYQSTGRGSLRCMGAVRRLARPVHPCGYPWPARLRITHSLTRQGRTSLIYHRIHRGRRTYAG